MLNLEIFTLLFLQISFQACPLLSMQNSDDINVRYFIIIIQASEALFIFFSVIFSLLFKLGNFDLSVTKFSDSFLSPLCSGVEPIRWGFFFWLFFQFQSFCWLFFISSFFLALFYILFFFSETFYFFSVLSVFVISCWRIFMTVAWKFFSGNSNSSVILMLVSVDCLFSFRWRFFCSLVWRMIFSWNLDTLHIMLWHSGFYLQFLF